MAETMIHECSGCGSEEVKVDEKEEFVCVDCGLVNDESDGIYVPPVRELTPFLGSVIEGIESQTEGLTRKAGERENWTRLGSVHTAVSFQSMNLNEDAVGAIKGTCARLGLPKRVADYALQLYKRAGARKLFEEYRKDGFFQGTEDMDLVGGYVFASATENRIPIMSEDVAHASGCNYDLTERTSEVLVRKLHLKNKGFEPKDYVPGFCSELKLSGEVAAKARKFLDDAKEKGIYNSRQDPRGVASGAIYAASILSNERRTQREVAWRARVSEVTVRKSCASLIEGLGIKVAY